MSTTIKNIALYLSSRVGIRTDYKLVLSLYMANHAAGGIPDGSLPISIAERKVDDIDSLNWYVFNFPFEFTIPSGYYSLVLHQQPNNVLNIPNFGVNFVEWVHTSCKNHTHKDISSFSSDLQFSSDVYGYGYTGHGLGSLYGTTLFYGYGYGYGDFSDPLDFFNVFEIGGTYTGYAIDEITSFYSYSYGFEEVNLVTDDVLQRTFKVYDNFNDIDFLGDNSVRINIPPANEKLLVFNNRQDFIDAEMDGTEIVNNYITLCDFGDRIIAADTAVLTSDCLKAKDIEWFKANLFLSGNDIIYADISNPIGNINPYGVYVVASVYYSGAFISFDGGSSWESKNNGLTLINNSERSFSCIKFGPDTSFILAFDNTNVSERGKVFITTDLGENWSLYSSDLLGIVVNDAYVVSSSEIWIGTSNGVYISLNGGLSWATLNTGLPISTNVNQIIIDTDILESYGYGYGGGIGIDYFDVIGFEGSFLGYGLGTFENDYTNSLSYGYGYEYGFSGGGSSIPIIATEFGVYWFVNGSWIRIYPDPGKPDVNTNTVLLTNNEIFIGKDDGLIRSEIVPFSEEPDGLIFRGHTVSDAISGDFYIQGLLRRKTTKIRSHKNFENEIFVSQYGGIYISKNSGGDFINSTKKINERSLRVKDILLNPLNNDIVYSIVENTRFSSAGVTIVIDCSGSMVANDPNEKRIDLALEIVGEIVSVATNTPYFQIIRFGVSEASYRRNKIIFQTLSDFDVNGAFNLTRGDRNKISDAGYSGDIAVVNQAIDILCREPASKREHSKTLLFDALAATTTGLLKEGSRWIYQEKDKNTNVFKYKFNTIKSGFYWNLDKSLIIITDGHNTVIGKTIEDIISNEINFGGIPSEVYIVGIGQDINYENLKKLKEAHNHANLYLAPYEENILSDSDLDISDIILDKEKFRTRNGVWKKFVDLEESKIIKNIFVKSNLPPNTTLQYRLRSSNDKKRFSDFTNSFDSNVTNSVDLSGRYFEIEISMESDSTLYAPEVSEIDIIILEPSESFVFYPLTELENVDRISEIELSSLDDISLDNLSEENIKVNFGIIQSNSTNFDLYDNVHRDKRSVLVRRTLEDLSSEDGFFFVAKNGAWPGDASIKVFDAIELEKNPNTAALSESKYFTIPSLGMIVFFDEVFINTKLKIQISNVSRYRVGISIKNLDDTISKIDLHDIAWTFYSESLSQLARPALPKVLSQLAETGTFGILAQNNYETFVGAHSTFLIQYILRENFPIGIISLTTGERLNLKTTGSSDILRFYNQNFAIEKVQILNAFDESYLRVLDTKGQNFGTLIEIKNTDPTNPNDPQIHYQINVKTPSNVNAGESIIFSLGDRGQGSLGIPIRFFQRNLLFDADNLTVGGIQTNFFIGDAAGNNVPSINQTGNLSFDKIITPQMNFIGQNATKLVIISPSVVEPGGFFTTKIIAVNEQGLIDEEFTGTILFGFEDPSIGTFVEGFKIQFSLSNGGVVNVSAFTPVSATGSTSILAGIVENFEQSNSTSFSASLFDVVHRGNTFIIDSSTKVRWGDLNLSTIFSDGRQDIDFISKYAKNVSKLDFVGITDDLDSIDNDEWKYIFNRSESVTDGSLLVIPGFKYRVNDFYGERMILFENATNPVNIITKPSTTPSPESQILNLINNLSNSDYITIPVHSPYKTDSEDFLFRGRGFVFERYRNILTFGGNQTAMEQFIQNKEVAVEVYSEHGNFETSEIYQNENFIGSQNNAFEISAYVQHALLIGKRFGFIASSGGYHSRPGYYTGDSSSKVQLPVGNMLSNKGLTAVLSNNLSRGNIISKIKERQCYATTGVRMYIFFEGETLGQIKNMGSVLTGLTFNGFGEPTESIKLRFRATADSSIISRIEIIRIKIDDNIITILDSRNTGLPAFNVVSFGKDTGILEFEDTFEISMISLSEIVEDQEFCYYVRFTQEDGHIGWSSPIWFNYGRIDGIRLSSETTIKTLYNPILSTSDTGTISNIPYSVSANPSSGSFLPQIHIDSFFTFGQLPRETYLDRDLFVSEKNINLAGLRFIKHNNKNVIYGTHFLKFIGSRSTSEFNAEAINPLTGRNGTGENDPNYKFLNDIGDPLENRPNFVKRHRSYWFGHMWQYTSDNEDFRTNNSFSFEGDINSNTIITSSADDFGDNSIENTFSEEKTKVVMKPFLYQENGIFYLFYSSSIVQYPEDPSALLGGIGGTLTYKDTMDATRPEAILSEETVGIGNLSSLGNWAGNFRINFARAFNSDSRINFIFDSTILIPNNFSGDEIWFMHSPCLIKLSGDIAEPYRLYYLGYLSTNPKLSIFCYSFSSIENPQGGTTSLCFTFNGGANVSFNSHNFTPYSLQDIEENGVSNNTWPEDSYYAIGTNWISAVEFDDSNIYIFYNFQNKGGKSLLNIQQSGVGVLFSFDGLTFYEKDPNNLNNSLMLINDVQYAHVFKYSFDDVENWYMVYQNSLQQIKYARINWTTAFTTEI